MPPPTVYFITGAGRGIGLGLVTEIVKKKSDVYVFAAARTITSALKELAANYPDQVSIVNFVAADEPVNTAAAKVVGDKFGHVDVVLNVAGIADYVGTAEETPADMMTEHFKVNATGTLVLYQAFAPLLKKSEDPKFIPISTGAASLTAYIELTIGVACYGASKAAMNYVARKIHFENEWITCFPLAPGFVLTDMAFANRAMDKSGTLGTLQDAYGIDAAVASKMILDIVESASRATHGGEFINIDGTKIAW